MIHNFKLCPARVVESKTGMGKAIPKSVINVLIGVPSPSVQDNSKCFYITTRYSPTINIPTEEAH